MTLSLADYAKTHKKKSGPPCPICAAGLKNEILAEAARGTRYSVIAEWLQEVVGIKLSHHYLQARVAQHVRGEVCGE